MQTPVKSVCIATTFYNYIIIPNCCQENLECRTIGSKKLLCPNIFLPLFSHREYKDTTHPENGVLCIYSVTLLAPKKHCGTTTFSCRNCCPRILCPTPKKQRLGRYIFTRSNSKKVEVCCNSYGPIIAGTPCVPEHECLPGLEAGHQQEEIV